MSVCIYSYAYRGWWHSNQIGGPIAIVVVIIIQQFVNYTKHKKWDKRGALLY